VEWDRGAISDALKNALDTPDELDLHEDYKQGEPMTKKQLRAARTKLCRILGGFGGRGQRAYETTGFIPRVTGEMEAEPET